MTKIYQITVRDAIEEQLLMSILGHCPTVDIVLISDNNEARSPCAATPPPTVPDTACPPAPKRVRATNAMLTEEEKTEAKRIQMKRRGMRRCPFICQNGWVEIPPIDNFRDEDA